MSTATADRLLKPGEVAAELRCSLRQVYDLAKRGELRSIRTGRVKGLVIFESSVRAFIGRPTVRA